jgi:DNA-binding CsgD family transcriptional regulator
MSVEASELGRISRFLAEIYAFRTRDELARHVVRTIPTLIGASSVGYNEVRLDQSLISTYIEPAPADYGIRDVDEISSRLMHEHPLINHHLRFPDGRAMLLSDVISQRNFHRLAIYNELFRHMRIERLMVSTFRASADGVLLAIAIARSGRDFSDRDRSVFDLVRPHLAQTWRNASELSRWQDDLRMLGDAAEASLRCAVMIIGGGEIRYANRRALVLCERYLGKTATQVPAVIREWLRGRERRSSGSAAQPRPPDAPLLIQAGAKRLTIHCAGRAGASGMVLLLEEDPTDDPAAALAVLGLSRREAQVLLWVARGKTSAEVGTILDVTRRAIDKHLEHIFDKLGVENRTAATGIALEVLHGRNWRRARTASI